MPTTRRYRAEFSSPGRTAGERGIIEYESEARANTKANFHAARMALLARYGSKAVSSLGSCTTSNSCASLTKTTRSTARHSSTFETRPSNGAFAELCSAAACSKQGDNSCSSTAPGASKISLRGNPPHGTAIPHRPTPAAARAASSTSMPTLKTRPLFPVDGFRRWTIQLAKRCSKSSACPCVRRSSTGVRTARQSALPIS